MKQNSSQFVSSIHEPQLATSNGFREILLSQILVSVLPVSDIKIKVNFKPDLFWL